MKIVSQVQLVLQHCPNALPFAILLMGTETSIDNEPLVVQLVSTYFTGTLERKLNNVTKCYTLGPAGRQLIEKSQRSVFVAMLRYFLKLSAPFAIPGLHEIFQRGIVYHVNIFSPSLVLQSSNEEAKQVLICKDLLATIEKHVVLSRHADVLTTIQGTLSEIILQKSIYSTH